MGAVSGAIVYVYDALYRLLAANYGDGTTFNYTYDAVGNRLTQTTITNTTVYTYDNANRLTNVGAISYTWDANGNLLNDGVYTYTYNTANRLITTTQGANVYAFRYNGLGDRQLQVVNGITTTYTLDLNAGLTQVLADVANGATNTYLYGNGRIAQYAGATPAYFLGDALGSVRQLANASGAVTLARSYEPFGNTLSSVGSGTTVYQFTGEMRDNTGLVYLRARYYAPGQGRFVSRDVWPGNDNRPISFNAWLYAYANPVNFVDPSGLQCSVNVITNEVECFGDVTGMGQTVTIEFPGCEMISTPETDAENTPDYNSCYAIAWVKGHRAEIIGSANRHGIPPELVGGILASEIDFDTEYLTDVMLDELLRSNDLALDLYLWLRPNPGPGTAQIHYDTWVIVQNYYQECGYDLGEIFLNQGGQFLSKRDWVKVMLTTEGAIEGASVVGRFLADYRTGTGGRPKNMPHYTDLTTNDMAHIFAAYRTGVGGLTCNGGDCGYPDILTYQSTTRLGNEASQALPYFEYFSQYFSRK